MKRGGRQYGKLPGLIAKRGADRIKNDETAQLYACASKVLYSFMLSKYHYSITTSRSAPTSNLKANVVAILDDAKGLPRTVLISASTDPHSDLLNEPLRTPTSSFGDRFNIALQTQGKEFMKTISSAPSIKHNLLRLLHLQSPLKLISC